MPIVPDDPERLVMEFLPALFEELAAPERSATSTSPGSGVPARAGGRAPAAAAVLLRVVGAGEWTLRVESGKLSVAPRAAADVALQVSLSQADFGPLVVEPLRSALAEQPAVAPSSASIWLRLGRWDEETVDLLRRQTGRILVRIEDAGVRRNIALTPGAQAFSLESAECTIDCALADLRELQTKRKNPLDLFYSGQIRIAGDAQVALAMAGLFL